jgi:uncharacterized glyoxalase superfamily protein PhnB
MATVKPIPDGYPQVTPYLCVDGASAAIEFYSQVFGATERMRMPEPDGKIGHAELQLGDSTASATRLPPAPCNSSSPKGLSSAALACAPWS